MRRYVFLLLIIGTVWTQTILDKLVLKDGKLTKESTINELEFSGNYGCINKICIFHIKYNYIEKRQNHKSDLGLTTENYWRFNQNRFNYSKKTVC